VPQAGLYSSSVLGLELGLEGDRLRFYYGMAPLPEAEDLISRLDQIVSGFVLRAERAEQERETEHAARERAEQERERAEQRVKELEAELARLRGDKT